VKLFLSPFAVLALCAAFGQAAPLDLKNVAADAKWVVHVDVDAVRDSQVVKKAFETCPALKTDSGRHFDQIRDRVGVDLRKDLHGVTLYGPDTDRAHAVAVVFSTVNQQLLLDKAAHAANHKVTKHGEIDIHSWTQKHGAKTQPAAGAFYKPDVLVFAANVEGVAAAIDVLDGKSPGNADRKLGGRVAAGASLAVRAAAIPPQVQCPILKQAESFRVALGENNGMSFYRGSLVMKSTEAAAQVKTIADGFKAIGSLSFSDDADVMKIIDGIKATVNDTTARVRWEASADDVWTVAEKVAKKAAEQRKKASLKAQSKDAKGSKADK